MNLLILGILTLVISACNVAEQKAVEEVASSQSSSDSKFDIATSNNFVGFRIEQTEADEDQSDDVKIKVYRTGDALTAQVVNIKIVESASDASVDDITSIKDQSGNILTIPATPDPIISFTFPPNIKNMDLFFDLADDSVYEGRELLTLKIEPNSADYSIQDYSTHQLDIVDNEITPAYTLSSATFTNTSTLTEGGASTPVVIYNWNTPADYNITYNLVYSGSANRDEFECDYPVAGSPLPNSVMIPADDQFLIMNISAKSDTYAENNETLVIDLVSASTTPYDEANWSSASIIFFDSLQKHTVNVTEASGLSNAVNITTTCVPITENSGGTCTIIATLTDEIDKDEYVDISFAGSATLGSDYQVSKTRMYFYKDQGASQTSSFVITPIDDSNFEGTESINISLSASPGLTLGGSSTTSVDILDNESAVTVGFQLANFSVLEGSNLNVPLALNNPSQTQVDVSYSINTAPSDSAAINLDHNLPSTGTFTIPAGSSTNSTTFLTLNDSVFDDKEVIYLTLTGVTSANATLNANTTLAITIRESGTLPVLSFDSANQTVIEGNTLTVNLSTDKINESGLDYTISINEINTDSSDYTYAPAILNRTFPSGGVTDSFTIAIDSDSTHEPTETFLLTITSAQSMALGSISTQTISVIDNSPLPSLDVAVSNTNVTEGNTESFDLTLSDASAFNIIVPYTLSGTSVSGDDYTLASGSVTIPKGTTTYSINLSALDDNLFEGSETVIITLGTNTSKYTLGTSSDTITIDDAQVAPTVSFGGNSGSGFDSFFEKIEGDIINIPLVLDHPSSNDIDITILVEDKWGATDDCDAKCATVFDYDSIHKNLAQVNVNAMDNTVGAQVGTSSTYRITFSGIPTVGTIDVDFNDSTGAYSGTSGISAAAITGADINAVCDNLVTAINNNSNGFIRSELYAFHKTDTDYIDIKPRPRFLDTTIDSYISGNTITITIPAGSTQGVISFDAVNDDLYELTTDERFRLTINAATGGTSINALKDFAGVSIEDVHNLPRAQFVQKQYARTEPQSDNTAILSVPIYLSNLSEIESDYLVTLINEPGGQLGIADENDFVIYDTLSKTNLEASSINSRIPGFINAGAIPSISDFPKFLYNETETAFDLYNNIDATVMDIKRKDSVATPNNIVTVLTFDSGINSGSFELFGISGTQTFDLDIICNGCVGAASVTALANHINTNYPNELIATANALELELKPAFLPSLQYTSNTVKTFRIKIPAGQSSDVIPIEIINDQYYEGSETFKIIISQISSSDPPVNTSLDTSGTPNNEATVTINDDENISKISISSNTGSSEAESTTSPRANIHSSTFAYNDVIYTVSIDPLFQSSDINFEVDFTGTMTYTPSVSSPAQFMMTDYQLDISGIDPNYTSNDNNGTVEITYPAGYSGNSFSLTARVHADYRYENDETLIASIKNNDAADLGSVNSVQTTFTDDDSTYPLLKVAGNPSFPISELEYSDQLTELTFIISDVFNVFTGEEITDIDASIDYEVIETFRHTASPSSANTGSISLTSAGNYEDTFQIDQFMVGDFRKFTNLNLQITNASDVNFDNGASFYDATPAYNLEFVFDNVPDVILKSAMSASGSTSNPTTSKLRSHTCSIHRGLVSCFGHNVYGKLGKGISDSEWGGSSSDDVTDQAEVLDLGTNDAGNPLYAKDVSLNVESTCVLFTNNKVKCFGLSRVLGLGLSGSDSIGDDPSEMGNSLNFLDLGLDPDDVIESIHAGESAHCVLVSTTGEVKCWGWNNFGILGAGYSNGDVIGDDPDEMGLNLLSVDFPGFINMFSMGTRHACAKNTANQIACWGEQVNGKLGNNQHFSTAIGDDPSELGNNLTFINTSGFGTVSEIDTGAQHTCLRTDARSTYNIRCFGSNYYGQLGLGRVTKSAATHTTSYSLSNVDNNDSNMIYVLGAGSVWSWMDYYEKFITDGHRDDFFYSSTEGSDLSHLPSHTESAPDEFDADFTRNNAGPLNLKNQHVQTYFPASEVKAGISYSCGVYSSYYINGSSPVTNSPHIRCWGSNYAPLVYSNPDVSGTYDLGLLNNVGWNKYFDGTHLGVTLPPFRTSYDGVNPHGEPTNVLSNSSVNHCVNNSSSTMCTFAKRRSDIGKDSFQFSVASSYSGDINLYRYFENPIVPAVTPPADTDEEYYKFGWLDNFEGTGDNLNFEMNHAYSMVKYDFSSYDDIDLTEGLFNTCALPRNNSPTHVSGSNNEFLCWGANFTGQAGVNKAQSCTGISTVIGGYDSCGTAQGGEIKSFDYSF